MIILGIDPGLARTGYAILKTDGLKTLNIVYGCLTTETKTPLEKRLEKISRELKKIIKKYKPERIGVESLFFGQNTKTALLVSQARGVVCLAAAEEKIPLLEFTPLQVKQTTTGYGKADKGQMQKMLKAIFNLKAVPTPDDAADALAIAYCCMQKKSYT
ncbi:MAG: crossover junction endodeoxyribonuclease RuvC [Patescibacteria group bacterium]